MDLRESRDTVVPEITKFNRRIEPLTRNDGIYSGIPPEDEGESNDQPCHDFAQEFNISPCLGNNDKHDYYKIGELRLCTDKGYITFLTHLTDRNKDFGGNVTGMLLDESLPMTDVREYELGVYLRPSEENMNCRPSEENVNCRPLEEKKEYMYGGFGEVKILKVEETGREFARKEVHKDDFNMLEAMKPNHQNVVSVLGVLVKQPFIYILLDWAGESVEKYLRRTDLSLLELIDCIIQGLEGLTHLARCRIRHLDIKPGNICICVSENLRLRLRFIDFGSAKLMCEPIPPNVGLSQYYLSPELCKFLKSGRASDIVISGKSDVYQFGLVILYVMSKKHVMEEMTKVRCKKKGLNVDDRKIMEKEYHDMMSSDEDIGQEAVKRSCYEGYKPLVSKMVAHSPEKRMDAIQVLELAKPKAKEIAEDNANQLKDMKRGLNEDKVEGNISQAESGERKQEDDTTSIKLPEWSSMVDNQPVGEEQEELLKMINGLEVVTSEEDEPYRADEGNLPWIL